MTSFGDLDAQAQECLPTIWSSLENIGGCRTYGTVFHVGYSLRRRRFAAFAYASEDGFQPTDLTDHAFFAMPCPTAPTSPPETVDEWIALGQAVQDDYALAPKMTDLKVIIGGDLIHTRLEIGQSAHRRVHRFPDDVPAFRRMMVGSHHWTGQLGPCPCGSGQPFVACHLRWHAGPCACDSGRDFADCGR